MEEEKICDQEIRHQQRGICKDNVVTGEKTYGLSQSFIVSR